MKIWFFSSVLFRLSRWKSFDTISPMTQWVSVMVRLVFVCTNLRVQCIPWFQQKFQCLIRFKGIEANYLYVYQTNFILKISHMNCFLHFIVIWNLMIQKGKWQPKKIKWYKGMFKSITWHSYFEKKPIK
jgi:hypothetical protein